MDLKYKRVLIKISGEALGDESGRGLDSSKLEIVCNQIKDIYDAGAEIGIVIGAGNFWRGRYGQDYMERSTSDYMGMLATTLNTLALQDMLESRGMQTRAQTALEIKQVAEPYVRRKAMSHLEKGRIVIFGCGTGNPYFTTDSAASLRAVEIGAEAILLAKNVDGVYDKDPNLDKTAKKIDEISYMDVINKGLKVMDATAITLCMENKLPIIVFGLNEPHSIKKAILGEKIGTIIR